MLLCLVLVVAVALRLLQLDHLSLWIDEAFSLSLSQKPLADLLPQREYNPPTYYLILHPWIRLAGDSASALRFPSVVFGTLAVLAIYRLGSELFGRRAGLASSLVLALAWYMVRYSQEARTYSLLILATLLSMLALVLLWKQPTRLRIVAYLGASTLLLHTHIYGVFVILAQNLAVLALWVLDPAFTRRVVGRWILLQLGLVALGAFWLVRVLSLLSIDHDTYWLVPPYLGTVVSSFRQYAGPKAWLALIPLALIGLAWSWRRERPAAVLLAAWVSVPIVLPFIVSRIGHPMYSTYYAMVVAPGLYTLAGCGLAVLVRASRVGWGVLAVLVLLQGYDLQHYYRTFRKEPWRDVAGELTTRFRDGDLVLTNRDVSDSGILVYYLPDDLPRPIDYSAGDTMRFDEPTLAHLRSLVAGAGRVWIVTSHVPDPGRLERIPPTLAPTHTRAEVLEFPFGITLHRYDPRSE